MIRLFALCAALAIACPVLAAEHAKGQSRDEWWPELHKIEASRARIHQLAAKLHAPGVSGQDRADWGKALRDERATLHALLEAQPKTHEHGFRGEWGSRNGSVSGAGE